MVKTPFYEEGLDELLQRVVGRNLVVSTSYGVLYDTDIVFITVGAPSRPDGGWKQEHIIGAVKELAKV